MIDDRVLQDLVVRLRRLPLERGRKRRVRVAGA
jgi:hypothetical protein